ncbi:hypothetical protein BD410DRAFT_786315 [Rickenella mellea]|uniref:DUF6533 domain-containing protein n=1 Tax=Rickenella mellea TaxID=50990 RepID=A0A4Y7QAF9_9AGAM|nr:hypothetical protein BD410DRAFT_786315 [Rickenella mellea]
MSALSPEQIQLLTSEYQSYYLIRYAYLSALTILVYDYLLTLNLEIKQVWKQKFTGASFLFMLNRYIFPLSILLEMIAASFPLSNSVRPPIHCGGVYRLADILTLIFTTVTALLIFTLRTWAIYMRSWIILIIVGLFALAKESMNIATLVSETSFVTLTPILPRCGGSRTDLYASASGYLSIAFDSVVFWLTFYKTIRSTLRMRKLGMTGTLTYWILRDGTIVFSPVLAGRLSVTILALVTFLPPAVEIFSGILANVAANVMINHLLLNLRQVTDLQHRGGLSEMTTTLPEVAFAANSFIGNLGAPVREISGEIARDVETLDGYEMESPIEVGRRTDRHLGM